MVNSKFTIHLAFSLFVVIIVSILSVSSAQIIDLTNDYIPKIPRDSHGSKFVFEQYLIGDYDIYICDLSTGLIRPISSSPYVNERFASIYGNYVVFEQSYNIYTHGTEYDNGDRAEVILVNLLTGESKPIGSPYSIDEYPDIYGDKVVWINNSTFITIYDISTGNKQNILLDENLTITEVRIYGNIVGAIGYITDNATRLYGVYIYDIVSNKSLAILHPAAGNGYISNLRVDKNYIAWSTTYGISYAKIPQVIDSNVSINIESIPDTGLIMGMDLKNGVIVYGESFYRTSPRIAGYNIETGVSEIIVPSNVDAYDPIIVDEYVVFIDSKHYDLHYVKLPDTLISDHFIGEEVYVDFSAKPEVHVGENVTFQAEVICSDNIIIDNDNLKWDLNGDGVVDATGKHVYYVYTDEGIYNVTLKVVVNGSVLGIATKQVRVVSLNMDSDEDGLTDYQENMLGLDPNNNRSALTSCLNISLIVNFNDSSYQIVDLRHTYLLEYNCSCCIDTIFMDLILPSNVSFSCQNTSIPSPFKVRYAIIPISDTTIIYRFVLTNISDGFYIFGIKLNGTIFNFTVLITSSLDYDSDGLNNSYELVIGTLPMLSDSDGDGLNDGVDPYPLDPTNGNVSNQPPVAKFSFKPDIPVIGEAVAFNASESYDPDGNISEYIWDFGDGTTAYGKIVEHVFNSSGMYTVALTVVDDRGMKNTTVKVIPVTLIKRILPRYVYPNSTFNVTLKVLSNVVVGVRLSEVVPSEFEIINVSNIKNISIEIEDNNITISMFGKVDNLTYTLKAPPFVGAYNFTGYIATLGQNTAEVSGIPIGGDTRIEVVNNQQSLDELKEKILADILEYMRNPSKELKQQILNKILEYVSLVSQLDMI